MFLHTLAVGRFAYPLYLDLDLQSDAFRAGMPLKRTLSGFLENNRAAFMADNDSTIAEILNQILVDILSNGSRYWGVNFFALRRYGTIEFRARCLQSASVAGGLGGHICELCHLDKQE